MTEDSIYSKIYECAFEKAREVWLTADNSWLSAGLRFIVWARLSEPCLNESFTSSSQVWWGRRQPPTLTPMRVYVPNIVLKMKSEILPRPNDIIDVGQDEFGSELKCIIGKSICEFLKSYNELRITLGYDAMTLLDASSIEELLVASDLNCKPSL